MHAVKGVIPIPSKATGDAIGKIPLPDHIAYVTEGPAILGLPAEPIDRIINISLITQSISPSGDPGI